MLTSFTSNVGIGGQNNFKHFYHKFLHSNISHFQAVESHHFQHELVDYTLQDLLSINTKRSFKIPFYIGTYSFRNLPNLSDLNWLISKICLEFNLNMSKYESKKKLKLNIIWKLQKRSVSIILFHLQMNIDKESFCLPRKETVFRIYAIFFKMHVTIV